MTLEGSLSCWSYVARFCIASNSLRRFLALFDLFIIFKTGSREASFNTTAIGSNCDCSLTCFTCRGFKAVKHNAQIITQVSERITA